MVIHPLVITHRGLEPSNSDFYPESSYEAFKNHLSRGFGIEFDLSFIKNKRIVIAHDTTLTRITNGKDRRSLKELFPDEILKISLGKGRLCFFEELMVLIRNSKCINALHLKGTFQKQPDIDILIQHLNQYAADLLGQLLIFDLKPETARYIKTKIPQVHLAPSVSHPYDIQRFNNAVYGTLSSVEEALQYKKGGLFDWVWLDEWDLTDKNDGTKKLYTPETFTVLRNAGYKIALVTPELHGTSPGLLGSEAHPDAIPQEKLFNRIKEILSLQPEAVCTDYPEETRSMIVVEEKL